MTSKKYHFLYKTINTKTGRYYIGVHSTDDLEDGYLGSGKLLSRAIALYGRDSFTREIIKFHETKDQAYAHERELVTEELIKSRTTYNISVGGNGGNTIAGFTEEERSALSARRSVANIRAGINRGPKNASYGKSPKQRLTPEAYSRWVENNKRARQGRGNGRYGTPPWESPLATEDTLKIWSRADIYFHAWKTNPEWGGTLLSKISDLPYNHGPHDNLVKRFRQGWIPWRDSSWVTFRRTLVETVPIFFTSDLHLFHHNVIKYAGRPFRNIEEMHATIVKRWNSQVPSYGVVYVLGDVGVSNIQKLKSVFDQLHGTLVLVSGNHDPGSNTMYKVGFSVVLNSATTYIGNHRIEMNHCPPRGVFREDVTNMRGSTEGENWHGESRHLRFSREYHDSAFWLHGHTHKGVKERTLGRMFDVGVDANNFTPVSSSQIESWISTHGGK